MKRRIVAIFLLLALLLAGCADEGGPISPEEAQQIALDHAGVKSAQNVHTHVVSTQENPCYSIHLTIDGISYEYLIDGITGEILSHGEGGH